MRFRLKQFVKVVGPQKAWLNHGAEFDGEWAPGWPTEPRRVRLHSPEHPADCAFVSDVHVEQVPEQS